MIARSVTLIFGSEVLYLKIPPEVLLRITIHFGQLRDIQVEGNIHCLILDIRDVLVVQIIKRHIFAI